MCWELQNKMMLSLCLCTCSLAGMAMAHMAEAHSAPTLSVWHWLSWDVQLLVAQCVALCPIALLQGSVLWHAVQGGSPLLAVPEGNYPPQLIPPSTLSLQRLPALIRHLDPCCRKVAEPAQSGGWSCLLLLLCALSSCWAGQVAGSKPAWCLHLEILCLFSFKSI